MRVAEASAPEDFNICDIAHGGYESRFQVPSSKFQVPVRGIRTSPDDALVLRMLHKTRKTLSPLALDRSVAVVKDFEIGMVENFFHELKPVLKRREECVAIHGAFDARKVKV